MAALDAGVHAYLTYPLSETLLIAQASALLRGGQGWEGTAVEIPGVLRIDPMAHRIWVQEQELQLSRRIFRLFHYLALHPGQTFSAAEIAHHLSDGRKFVQENTIAAQIHRLRKALEAAGADIWLETVHGFGYRLSVPAS
ncbi:MAG: winged helix-turn-helix domain-containing protein [Acidithiobacillus caldus]|nr:winged helix-turn-helix domain-containing protein [Acidithiobacillus caldus]